MTLRDKVLLACALILGVIYVIFFTDLFRKPKIQIIPQVRPDRASAIPRPRDSAPVYPVSFRFNKRYQFKSIKVVKTADYATNRFAVPLWHVVSDSNSAPQNSIVYGAPKIPGMRTAVARAKPQPLEAGVEYMLLVETPKIKAQTNFTAREFVPREQPSR
jgi:hypothetical protein